jgi:hypothetical protein
MDFFEAIQNERLNGKEEIETWDIQIEQNLY